MSRLIYKLVGEEWGFVILTEASDCDGTIFSGPLGTSLHKELKDSGSIRNRTLLKAELDNLVLTQKAERAWKD